MKLCLNKQCDRRGQLLPLTDFPRNRTREDGRDRYCRNCCARKQEAYRRNKGIRPRNFTNNPDVRRKRMVLAVNPYAFSKVYEVLQSGPKSREDIKEETGLDYDSIGEALAELMFVCRAVKIKEREFHIAA